MSRTYARMTETQVQRDIAVFLALLGYLVSDFSQPRATKQTPGIPDLHAMGHGHSLANGETVVVARSAHDLVETLRALGAPIHPTP